MIFTDYAIIAVLVILLIVEIIALVNKKKYDTISERVRYWTSFSNYIKYGIIFTLGVLAGHFWK